MKKIFFTMLITILVAFSSGAQTPEQIYATASQDVQKRMDENKKNGEDLLKGITAQHVFKIDKRENLLIADLDVHIIEAPGMISYAMNLNTSWSKVKSLEFQCNATFTTDEIKTYFAKINVTITKDKVTFSAQ